MINVSLLSEKKQTVKVDRPGDFIWIGLIWRKDSRLILAAWWENLIPSSEKLVATLKGQTDFSSGIQMARRLHRQVLITGVTHQKSERGGTQRLSWWVFGSAEGGTTEPQCLGFEDGTKVTARVRNQSVSTNCSGRIAD